MALRARGRSRVMTATPFGWMLPLTNSSAPAMAAKDRWETGSWEELIWKKLREGRLRERENVEDLITNCEALNPSKFCMFLWSFYPLAGGGRTKETTKGEQLRRSSQQTFSWKRRRFVMVLWLKMNDWKLGIKQNSIRTLWCLFFNGSEFYF